MKLSLLHQEIFTVYTPCSECFQSNVTSKQTKVTVYKIGVQSRLDLIAFLVCDLQNRYPIGVFDTLPLCTCQPQYPPMWGNSFFNIPGWKQYFKSNLLALVLVLLDILMLPSVVCNKVYRTVKCPTLGPTYSINTRREIGGHTIDRYIMFFNLYHVIKFLVWPWRQLRTCARLRRRWQHAVRPCAQEEQCWEKQCRVHKRNSVHSINSSSCTLKHSITQQNMYETFTGSSVIGLLMCPCTLT